MDKKTAITTNAKASVGPVSCDVCELFICSILIIIASKYGAVTLPNVPVNVPGVTLRLNAADVSYISSKWLYRRSVMKILLTYPEFTDTFWSFKYALKFVGKKAANPPLGLVTVAALLPEDWQVKLVDLNISPLKDEDILWADYVFISAMTVQRNSTHRLMARCHKLNRKIVAGGPLFTCEPDSFPQADYLILNEGEITLKAFIHDLEHGTPQRIYQSSEFPDIKQTPIPRFELLELSKYDCMCIQYSRGCPFRCDFCNVTALNGHTPRIKCKDQFIAELNYLYSLGWRHSVFIVDDNFIGNKNYLKSDLLPALIEWRKGKTGFDFITEVSVNLSDDEELMRMMVDAGFNSVFVGIETPSEEGLKECNKFQNTRRNLLDSVHRMQSVGLQVMAGFIVGFDSDTPSIFQTQYDFIQESGIVTAMVGMLQAPEGTELYAKMKSAGRIRDDFSGDNGDGETNLIPVMDTAQLKEGFVELVRKLYTPKFVYQRIRTLLYYYQPSKNPSPLTFTEVVAFFRSVFYIGILSDARQEYWKLFFWTLKNYPDKFALAITMSVYAYHFRKMSLHHLHEKEKLQLAPGLSTQRQSVQVRL